MGSGKGVLRRPTAAIVTVHGTGDTAESVNGQKWFQIGSPFIRSLQAVVAGRGVETEVVPFIWSGANSSTAREAASEDLVKLLTDLTRRHASVHIIGHSHGGNVANEAVCRMRLPDAVRAAMAKAAFARFNPFRLLAPRGTTAPASVTTVGTPFFATKLPDAESFNPAIAIALAWFGLLGFIATIVVAWLLFMTGPELSTAIGGKASQGDSVRLILLIAAALLALVLNAIGSWHLFRHGRAEAVRRARLTLTEVLRLNSDAAETRVRAIWHENDEAIAFLQKVEALPIEPLGKGMLMSRSRRTAIVNGIRFAIFTPIAAAVLGTIGAGVLLGLDYLDAGMLPEDWVIYLILPIAVAVAAVGASPLLFGIAYLANRLAFGVVPEAIRKHLNGFIRGTFTGMAFGRDGAEGLGSVAPRSHILETDEVVLSGDIAVRMREGAAVAAGQLIDKYRWALFTVGADTNASLNAMASDAMTWNSLIHTTYFDQPEMAGMIGDHIVARHAATAHPAA